MKVKLLILLIFCLINFILKAQKLDSIKHKYGHLYFHEFGQGKPIVILSGGPGNSYSQIQEVAIKLSRKYRSILLEQRGTGRSIPTPFDSITINLQTLIDDLNVLLNHLKLKDAIILGHSWGGMLAMSFAANHPSKVRSLVLIGPGPYKDQAQSLQRLQMNIRTRLGESEVDRFNLLNDKITRGSATAADSSEQKKLFRSTYVYQKPMSDTLFKKIDVAVYPLMRQLIVKDLGKNYNLSKTLSKYKGSIQVITGRQDILADNTYELKILRPSVQINWIEESGHFPMFEKPKEFYKLLFKIIEAVK